jgi:hypothetical protein
MRIRMVELKNLIGLLSTRPRERNEIYHCPSVSVSVLYNGTDTDTELEPDNAKRKKNFVLSCMTRPGIEPVPVNKQCSAHGRQVRTTATSNCRSTLQPYGIPYDLWDPGASCQKISNLDSLKLIPGLNIPSFYFLPVEKFRASVTSRSIVWVLCIWICGPTSVGTKGGEKDEGQWYSYFFPTPRSTWLESPAYTHFPLLRQRGVRVEPHS